MASPGMRQAAAAQISMLLVYQSIPKVSSSQSLDLHNHQSFCQDVDSTFSTEAVASLFSCSAKPQTCHVFSLLAIESLIWPLSPCFLFFSWEERGREGKRNVKRHQLKSETRQQSSPSAVFLLTPSFTVLKA